MARYRYEALDSKGKKFEGIIDASDEREVRKVLRGQGLRIKKIVPPSILEFDLAAWLQEKGFTRSFDRKALMTFTKQLAVMVNAGVPILQSLEILYKSEKQPSLKMAIRKTAQLVGEGKTIADALAEQPGFDKLYCNLVRAGEAGGILDTILAKLAIYLEKQEKIKNQIQSAMIYPAIVCVIGAVVIWAMMFFVVPVFTDMLKESGQAIPGITQFVIDVANFVGKYTIVMIPAIFVIIAILVNFIKTPAGKIAFDNFILKLPLFGAVVVKANLSSFSNTLSTLLSAGISLTDALDICVDTIDNGVIARDLADVKKKILEGKTLTEPLAKIDYFPELVTQMIRVGEQTGQIDQMLFRVSVVFEEEVDQLVGRLTKLIEPLIIVVLGGLVAGILVAMYLPMFMQAGGTQ